MAALVEKDFFLLVFYLLLLSSSPFSQQSKFDLIFTD